MTPQFVETVKLPAGTYAVTVGLYRQPFAEDGTPLPGLGNPAVVDTKVVTVK